MSRLLIARVERTALLLGGLATAASVVSLDPGVVAGVFIGAAIGWLNLAAVRAVFERGAQVPSDRHTAVLAVFLGKSVLLLGVVAAILLLTRIDGVAFIAGFSAAVLAVLVVPVLGLWGSAEREGGQDGEGA